MLQRLVTLPPVGQAELLRDIFSPEEVTDFQREYALNPIQFLPNDLRPHEVDETLSLLRKKGLTMTAEGVERLGKLALDYDDQLTHLAARPKSTASIGPHRDGIPVDEGISFIVVISGQIDYRLNGWPILHRLRPFETATAGDVLCLNNDCRYSRRPIHSARAGRGQRLILDYVLPPKPSHLLA